MRSYENVIHAADFERVTAPARPVEGIVRDRETGRPLLGVLVHAERHHFASTFRPSYPMIDWPGMAIVATTDEKGHYRLTGLPAREGVFVRAEPAEEQPYHAAIREAGNPPGLDPARLDFELKRGIPVRGRVLDRRPAPRSRQWSSTIPRSTTRTSTGRTAGIAIRNFARRGPTARFSRGGLSRPGAGGRHGPRGPLPHRRADRGRCRACPRSRAG